jgi:hypothetical protein
MKSFVILGSVVGFLIGAGFSLANECPWPAVLWRAAAAALAAALLTRWWSHVWLQGLRETIEQNRRARSAPNVETKSAAKL